MGRVCKRWRRLVKDQRLWRAVDLSEWKGVTSRLLWVLLRQYFGCGLRCLHLRGLLLSARGGAFLSESWLQTLASRCPRLRKLSLLHVDLRVLRSCLFLPPTLQVLELRGCELPPGFFSMSSSLSSTDHSGGKTGNRMGRASSATSTTLAGSHAASSVVDTTAGGTAIETLVLDNVPSFTDLHLQSLVSWKRLSRLELRDVIRITAAGLRSCAAQESGIGGDEGPGVAFRLSQLMSLELGNSGRPGSQTQMASLGLGEGWAGLEELTLGGREVAPGLLCVCRLKDLQRLRLRGCLLSEVQVLRSCRGLRNLQRLEFCEVTFQGHQKKWDAKENDRHEGSESGNEKEDPMPTLRRSLGGLLPGCTLVFTRCSVTMPSE
ncbi:F-box/LRR-repeat protein 12-like [Scleropages formosus]|nr:F-box/LRR-repeat protein 12-like [Scleropages formosus]